MKFAHATQARVQTRISQHLQAIKDGAGAYEPVTPAAFKERWLTMPEHIRLWDEQPPENAFALPAWLERSLMEEYTGKIKSEITLVQEMLLLAFEATPRPVSFGMTGYGPLHFIAYIYQDVFYEENGIAEIISRDEAIQKKIGFKKTSGDLKSNLYEGMYFRHFYMKIFDWLRYTEKHRTKNCAISHIEARLHLLTGRSKQNVESFHRPLAQIPAETALFHKLMERDDETGYTKGSLRDYRLVRQDFNLLGEYCFYSRHKNSSDQDPMWRLERVCCPSIVNRLGGFSNHIIKKKAGRKPKGEES